MTPFHRKKNIIQITKITNIYSKKLTINPKFINKSLPIPPAPTLLESFGGVLAEYFLQWMECSVSLKRLWQCQEYF